MGQRGEGCGREGEGTPDEKARLWKRGVGGLFHTVDEEEAGGEDGVVLEVPGAEDGPDGRPRGAGGVPRPVVPRRAGGHEGGAVEPEEEQRGGDDRDSEQHGEEEEVDHLST